MKSLQDYIDTYREIANNLQLTGDSVELLIQMIANATYISEVEQVSYANEASLERATLLNSKIQHCCDTMYSVYRGKCPRVILRFKCNKIMSYKRNDIVYSSNRFSLYYDQDSETFYPDANEGKIHTIECILAAERIIDTQTLPDYNRYYIDLNYNNLSNDCYIKVNGKDVDVYRRFADHLRYGGIFDLTLPNFGMRLYAPDIFRKKPEVESYEDGEELPPANTQIMTGVYRYCLLSDFNMTELSKINIKGTEFPSKLPSETFPGITLISEVPRDTTEKIHYKANRERYTNSIIRSNTDVGWMLEEMFPDKVVKGGTFYDFVKLRKMEDEVVDDTETPPITVPGYRLRLRIYYIPQNEIKKITSADQSKFIEECSSYYITEDITIMEGEKCNIIFTINVETYQDLRIDDEVMKVLSQYEDIFNMNLKEKLPEIESAICKIPNVRSLVRTIDTEGNIVDTGIGFYQKKLDGSRIDYIPGKTKYCKIDCSIRSKTTYRD